MQWSRSRSADTGSDGTSGADPVPDPQPGTDALRRHFVEALRRAEIVSLLNASPDEDELGRTFSEELCEVFDAEIAFLAEGESAAGPPRLIASVGLVPAAGRKLLGDPVVTEALGGSRAANLVEPELGSLGIRRLLLAPFAMARGRRILVGVARVYDRDFDQMEVALLEAATESAGHALERLWTADERDQRASQQLALARAAKALTSSLEIDDVLTTLCEEATAALRADEGVAYLGDETDGYTAIGIAGLPESFRGHRRAPGDGLGALAAADDAPRITHAYQDDAYAPLDVSALDHVQTAAAVPLRWDGRVRGFIAVGFASQRTISDSDIELIEGFAELAALACANAERHASVREAADQDALTKCLNQSAFRRALRRAIAWAEREHQHLCLAILDLDGFKEINDAFGHPKGDAVLRDVGSLIRSSIRDDDRVARYGGDEFAIVLPDLLEASAQPVLERLLSTFASIQVPRGITLSGCAGFAAWRPGEEARSLIGRADAALLEAKRVGAGTVRWSRGEIGAAEHPSGTIEMITTQTARGRPEGGERLQALAGRIGLKIARENELTSAAEAAVWELAAALAVSECIVVSQDDEGRIQKVAEYTRAGREASDHFSSASAGPSVERCIRERRPVLGPGEGADSRTDEELAVPVLTGLRVWGALACYADGEPFGPEDAKLAEVVAEYLGNTIRAIELNETLRQTLIGTAQSLAAALEAKDTYTAEHARSIADLAVAVGQELGLTAIELEDVRYGAIFHDIGKIAVPDAILNKAGPLTEEEFESIRRHPAVGEEILAPVPVFHRVRQIVRHDHEHWDGSGYPDGLRGEEIPIGARIVLVADAYSAMVSDRPYRSSMAHAEACAELQRNAGSQFDREVVKAFLTVVERDPGLVQIMPAREEG